MICDACRNRTPRRTCAAALAELGRIWWCDLERPESCRHYEPGVWSVDGYGRRQDGAGSTIERKVSQG
jgi:hypothetical protein